MGSIWKSISISTRSLTPSGFLFLSFCNSWYS
nr:MAG TPA: hypothetical protein [Caudoviricetes sp.]